MPQGMQLHHVSLVLWACPDPSASASSAGPRGPHRGTVSVTVAPLTSTLVEAPLLRVRVGADDVTGLQQESHVMIDKLTTVRCDNVGARVGRLTSENLVEVERALMAFLGLAR